MGKMKDFLMNKSKRLLIVFGKKKSYNDLKTISAISTLAPKVLTDPKDIKKIQPYLDRLKNAIDTEDINNIALMGNYGSGKSTILKTFFSLHSDYKKLNISLASFKTDYISSENKTKADDDKAPSQEDSKKDYDDSFERKLEISILQQMIYHVDPSDIPDSRFKRIINIPFKQSIKVAFFWVIWLASSVNIFKFKYLNELNPNNWSFDKKFSFVAFFSFICFSYGVGCLIARIYRLLKNSKISKFNIKGELELCEINDKSIFNHYLEEIIYFFEKTKMELIIIEDLDRYNNTEIFTKLREINIIINNSKLIKHSVKFIYAIRDEMFNDKCNRVKFFEYILPIIPFINSSNASDQLNKLIDENELQTALSKDFTTDIVTFIPDIDMRLLINIFHEFKLYKELLPKSLKYENLFAIMAYKNLYPDDFSKLNTNKGDLYDLFANKSDYCRDIILSKGSRIKEIDNLLDKIDNEKLKSLKELRAVFLLKVIDEILKMNSFLCFANDQGDLSLDSACEVQFFKTSIESNEFKYKYQKIGTDRYGNHVNNILNNSFTTKNNEFFKTNEFVKEYYNREEIITNKVMNRIEELKKERYNLTEDISRISSLSIKDLLLYSNNSLIIDKLDNALLYYLISEGYLDENYNDYISIFHEYNLTKSDYNFERSVKTDVKLDFDYKLTKINYIVKRVSLNHFLKPSILNFDLLDFLHSNSISYSLQLNNFYSILKNNDHFDFMIKYLNNRPNYRQVFIIKLLTVNKSFWSYLKFKSKHPNEEINKIISYIFMFSKIELIKDLQDIEALDSHISELGEFFKYCSELQDNNSTFINYIKERKIKIKNLDTPLDKQNILIKYLYDNDAYELTSTNIQIIVNNIINKDYSIRLTESNYTTILSLNLPKMHNYISKNLELYIKNIMLLESNNQELEVTLICLLNNDSISIELKKELIKHNKIEITDLSKVKALEQKRLLIQFKKLTINWDNIFNYYVSYESDDDFDSILINLISQNAFKISELGTPKLTKYNEDYYDQFIDSVVHCSKFGEDNYKSLIKIIPLDYDRFDFENIELYQINILLNSSLIPFTIENYNLLRKLNNKTHINLLENHNDLFVNMLEELELELEDYEEILKSTQISDKNKIMVIESMKENQIIDNKFFLDYIACLIQRGNMIKLNSALLLNLNKLISDIEHKIQIILYNLKKITKMEYKDYISSINENYNKVFIKRSRTRFENTSENIKLFNNLKYNQLIKSVKIINDKEIMVIGNYK